MVLSNYIHNNAIAWVATMLFRLYSYEFARRRYNSYYLWSYNNTIINNNINFTEGKIIMNLQEFTISTKEIREKHNITLASLHRYCNEYRYNNNGYIYLNKPIFICGVDYVFNNGHRFFHKSFDKVDLQKIIKERLLKQKQISHSERTFKNLGKVEK